MTAGPTAKNDGQRTKRAVQLVGTVVAKPRKDSASLAQDLD